MTTLTGVVYYGPLNGGVFGAGDTGMAGVTVTNVGIPSGLSLSAVTDSGGAYSIDTTAQQVAGDSSSTLSAAASDDFVINYVPPLGSNPQFDNNVDIPYSTRCCRPGSPWVKKICYIPGEGVKITFKDKKGDKTFTYPSMSLSDKDFLCACGCPGHWLLTIYRGNIHTPGATSP